MTKKLIIKSTRKKYKIFKNFKHIKLNKYKVLQNAFDNVDFSVNYTDKKFFKLPNGDAIFKIIEDETLILNEILASIIAKELDVNCVEYKYATYKKKGKTHKGVVSYNFVGKEERFVPCCNIIYTIHNTLEEIMNYIKSKDLDFYYQFNSTDLEFDLFKIIVFDYLICQTDRHDANFGFIVSTNQQPKTLKVAPIFDNELSFGSVVNNTHTSLGKAINSNLLFSPFGCGELPENQKRGYEYHELARDIAIYSQQKPALKLYLYQALKDFNIEKVFKKLEEVGIKLNPTQKQWYSKILNKKITALSYQIASVRRNETTSSKKGREKKKSTSSLYK